MPLVLEEAAKLDLRQIAFYLESETSLATALRFRHQAEHSFSQLLVTPFLGSWWPFDDVRLHDVRCWPISGFKKHLMFYRINDDRIQVLRILHAARDIARLLENEGQGSA